MNRVSRSSTAREDRTHLATVMTAFQPIEDYRSSDPAAGSSSINPLDFYLVHLLLDFLPPSRVVDLARSAGAGEPAVAAALHDEVEQVMLVDSKSAVKERIGSFLQRADASGQTTNKLRWVDCLDSISMPPTGQLLIWLHLDADELESFGTLVSQVALRFPDAILLVTGLGTVGNCPGIKILLNQFGSSFHLAREFVEVFGQSTLGVLCRTNHAPFGQALRRIQQLHNGNLDYLRLLRATHFHAMETARAQDMAEDEARSFPELNDKIIQRSRQELEAEIESLRSKLAVPPPVVIVAPPVDPIVTSKAYRLAVRLQRLRNRVAPPQSLRFRIYRATMKAAKLAIWSPLRWLRRQARQGLRLR